MDGWQGLDRGHPRRCGRANEEQTVQIASELYLWAPCGVATPRSSSELVRRQAVTIRYACRDITTSHHHHPGSSEIIFRRLAAQNLELLPASTRLPRSRKRIWFCFRISGASDQNLEPLFFKRRVSSLLILGRCVGMYTTWGFFH